MGVAGTTGIGISIIIGAVEIGISAARGGITGVVGMTGIGIGIIIGVAGVTGIGIGTTRG
jgi:hypothetical protein